MQINIDNPQQQTIIFTILIFITALLFLKKKQSLSFDLSLTNELKGFAILAVVFSHIGYFLSNNNQFLFPLSILAGVAVNLFLFLSGFGLTLSSLKQSGTVLEFYNKRLRKVFSPFWTVLIVLFIADWLVLGRTYTTQTIIQSFLGWFPRANLWLDVDSPLWYFTLIFFYYLIFPFLFFKRLPWLSALLILGIGLLIVRLPLPLDERVLSLYKLHLLAFPSGMFLASIINKKSFLDIFGKFYLNLVLRYLTILILLAIFVYTAINSGVGQDIKIEQTISLVTMFSLIVIFWFKKIEFKLLGLVGIYSYEIYLLHWPILARYDIIYSHLPGYLATFIYLGVFIVLGIILQKITKIISS